MLSGNRPQAPHADRLRALAGRVALHRVCRRVHPIQARVHRALIVRVRRPAEALRAALQAAGRAARLQAAGRRLQAAGRVHRLQVRAGRAVLLHRRPALHRAVLHVEARPARAVVGQVQVHPARRARPRAVVGPRVRVLQALRV